MSTNRAGLQAPTEIEEYLRMSHNKLRLNLLNSVVGIATENLINQPGPSVIIPI